MAMGLRKDRQGDLMVGWAEMPRSPGHVFYDRLQSVLIEGGFDGFAEAACRCCYAARTGAPSVPPGRCFRRHLVGDFEGIDSGRGLEWRGSDSLSLREFLRLESRDRVPDHCWLSKTRTRLPHEGHAAVFDRVLTPTPESPAECVADKGDHSRAVLKALDDSPCKTRPCKTRIAEPRQKGFSRWRGDQAARRAVTNNRVRLKSALAREAFKLRAEIVERCFAHSLDRGGLRRTWLRRRENVHKRYLLHVAGHNLSLLMRQLIGTGTARQAVAGGSGGIFVLVAPAGAVLVARIVLIVSEDGETAGAALCFVVG